MKRRLYNELMPIKIHPGLPARKILEQEHVAFISEEDALRQDIRPLQIAILNLMPDKITTETQLLRALGNTPLQIEITFLRAAMHESKTTPHEHLATFYKTHADVRHRKFDGLIVTGAPIGHLAYEDIHYWPELVEIFDWTTTHVHSSLFLCWATFAGLHHYDNIPKNRMAKKLSGIYPHKILKPFSPLVAGLDDTIDVPVSRYSEIREEDIRHHPSLEILAASDKAGIFLIEDKANRRIYVLNHLEYDEMTLKKEYERDIAAGKNPSIPYNYFPEDDPSQEPKMTWRAHRTLLFGNWINTIYQSVPYEWCL